MIREFQQYLADRGFNPGPADGVFGRKTYDAAVAAIGGHVPAAVRMIPSDWLPQCRMDRVICHWTAGTHIPNAVDRQHYHILIAGDGTLVRGLASIKDNSHPPSAHYAAHTLNCNSGSIGVSLCGMAGAIESPFRPGDYPINESQWASLVQVVRELCDFYSIPVTLKTVLTHAEVQANIGVTQRNKWDIAVLPWLPTFRGARAIGDKLRDEVSK